MTPVRQTLITSGIALVRSLPRIRFKTRCDQNGTGNSCDGHERQCVALDDHSLFQTGECVRKGRKRPGKAPSKLLSTRTSFVNKVRLTVWELHGLLLHVMESDAVLVMARGGAP